MYDLRQRYVVQAAIGAGEQDAALRRAHANNGAERRHERAGLLSGKRVVGVDDPVFRCRYERGWVAGVFRRHNGNACQLKLSIAKGAFDLARREIDDPGVEACRGECRFVEKLETIGETAEFDLTDVTDFWNEVEEGRWLHLN